MNKYNLLLANKPLPFPGGSQLSRLCCLGRPASEGLRQVRRPQRTWPPPGCPGACTPPPFRLERTWSICEPQREGTQMSQNFPLCSNLGHRRPSRFSTHSGILTRVNPHGSASSSLTRFSSTREMSDIERHRTLCDIAKSLLWALHKCTQ